MDRFELETKIVRRAISDPDFLARLKSNPRVAIMEETGLVLPEELTINVIEEDETSLNIIVPTMAQEALSDAELERVAGGTGGHHYHTFCMNHSLILRPNIPC